MHPIIAEQMAADRRSGQLEAATQRRRARSAAVVRLHDHWHVRLGRRLMVRARRLGRRLDADLPTRGDDGNRVEAS